MDLMNQTANLQAAVEFPSLQIGGRLISFEKPRLMGIINVNNNSFLEASRVSAIDEALNLAGKHVEEGAFFLDLGAASSKPGSALSNPDEEWLRLKPVLQAVREAFPKILISVDTYHSTVVEKAMDCGADLINDISAGSIDPQLLDTVIRLKAPYILMHMQGKPENMQVNPSYEDVTVEVLGALAEKLAFLRANGHGNVLVDVGFGFGKSLEHNYSLLRNLSLFRSLKAPLLVGLSRKSMVTRLLKVSADEALNGTTALHVLALLNGAHILRVHDVAPAAEALRIVQAYKGIFD